MRVSISSSIFLVASCLWATFFFGSGIPQWAIFFFNKDILSFVSGGIRGGRHHSQHNISGGQWKHRFGCTLALPWNILAFLSIPFESTRESVTQLQACPNKKCVLFDSLESDLLFFLLNRYITTYNYITTYQ